MKSKPINKSDFDNSVRPQDDFYRYVNGSWLKRNKIPPTENRWGSFLTLRHKNRKVLRTLLDELVTKRNLPLGSDLRKLRDLYHSSLDSKKRNRQGLAYLQEGFARIGQLKRRTDVAELLGYLHMRGVDAPWGLGIDQDDKNSRRMVLRLYQSGIGVPDRNYHVKRDAESRRVRKAYQNYIVTMLRLEGHYQSEKKINEAVQTILRIETKLARASMTPVERRDTRAQYNKYSLTKLERSYPAVQWKLYLKALRVPRRAWSNIIVNQPRFLAACNALLIKASLADLQVYLRWHFLDTYALTLGEAYLKASFAYHGVAIQGLRRSPESWKRGIAIADSLMGDALGKLYVQRCFPARSKKAITKLVHNLVEAYRFRIRKLDWMSKATRMRAIRKLDAISLQLGYPDKWLSYRKLVITRESFTQNVLNGYLFDFAVEMKKLAKPTNRTDWFISAPTVNAFYSPNLNQITFPAGILQPPFFYAGADDAINYGAIGATIGHELTHGFDDCGALFDEKGNLRNWWVKADRERFEKRTKVLEKQFNAYRVVEGINVNGKLTLGENIADLGGIVIAYTAFESTRQAEKGKHLDGFTPKERFFISHALSERTLVRDEFLKFSVRNDPHSPNEFRSNGPLSNLGEFYDAFNVQRGDKLYRAAGARASIW
ncbi:MAG TPA: M13 family metallopeptidase [Candidatus Paceibacterota bacterium]